MVHGSAACNVSPSESCEVMRRNLVKACNCTWFVLGLLKWVMPLCTSQLTPGNFNLEITI